MAVVTAAFQVVSLMGYTSMVIAGILLWRRWSEARALVVYPTLWALYGVVFYVLILTGRLAGDTQLLFGAIHRTLSMVMGLGFLFGLWAILVAPPDDMDHINDGE